jgi:hypothetical protein
VPLRVRHYASSAAAGPTRNAATKVRGGAATHVAAQALERNLECELLTNATTRLAPHFGTVVELGLAVIVAVQSLAIGSFRQPARGPNRWAHRLFAGAVVPVPEPGEAAEAACSDRRVGRSGGSGHGSHGSAAA